MTLSTAASWCPSSALPTAWTCIRTYLTASSVTSELGHTWTLGLVMDWHRYPNLYFIKSKSWHLPCNNWFSGMSSFSNTLASYFAMLPPPIASTSVLDSCTSTLAKVTSASSTSIFLELAKLKSSLDSFLFEVNANSARSSRIGVKP